MIMQVIVLLRAARLGPVLRIKVTARSRVGQGILLLRTVKAVRQLRAARLILPKFLLRPRRTRMVLLGWIPFLAGLSSSIVLSKSVQWSFLMAANRTAKLLLTLFRRSVMFARCSRVNFLSLILKFRALMARLVLVFAVGLFMAMWLPCRRLLLAILGMGSAFRLVTRLLALILILFLNRRNGVLLRRRVILVFVMKSVLSSMSDSRAQFTV